MRLPSTMTPIEVAWTSLGAVAVLVHSYLLLLAVVTLREVYQQRRNGGSRILAWTRLGVTVGLLLVQLVNLAIGVNALLDGPRGVAVSGLILNQVNLTVLGFWTAWRQGYLNRYLERQDDARAEVTMSGDGLIRSFSDGAERLFGWHAEEVYGQPVTMLMPPAFRAAHEEGLARYHESGLTRVVGRVVRVQALCKDGTTVPIKLAVRMVEDNGDTRFAATIEREETT